MYDMAMRKVVVFMKKSTKMSASDVPRPDPTIIKTAYKEDLLC
jgi:hypothetical protein